MIDLIIGDGHVTSDSDATAAKLRRPDGVEVAQSAWKIHKENVAKGLVPKTKEKNSHIPNTPFNIVRMETGSGKTITKSISLVDLPSKADQGRFYPKPASNDWAGTSHKPRHETVSLDGSIAVKREIKKEAVAAASTARRTKSLPQLRSAPALATVKQEPVQPLEQPKVIVIAPLPEPPALERKPRVSRYASSWEAFREARRAGDVTILPPISGSCGRRWTPAQVGGQLTYFSCLVGNSVACNHC